MKAETDQTSQAITTIWPGPTMHVAMGGLICALIAAPIITSPFHVYAAPNPLGYLLVLLGLPIGGLVFRIRSRRMPINPDAKLNAKIGIAATMLLPLFLTVLARTSSQATAFIGIGFLVAMSATIAILSCGFRRAL